MKEKRKLQTILIVVACLLLTLSSFAIFYIFKPLDIKWIILLCIVDVGFSILPAFLPFTYDKKEDFKLKGVGISLLYLLIYFIIFNFLGMFTLWRMGNFILYWKECIYFSIFIMPCHYIVTPIMMACGEAVGM